MKLYRIAQTENDNYDTYDSAIVCAENEEQARDIDPEHLRADTSEIFRDWNNAPHYTAWARNHSAVSVEYIGEARPGLSVGIVLASFNAG